MDNKLIFKENSTLKEAIQMLDRLGKGFLPIVDAENTLLGILTDGDIRRAILSGKSDLGEVMNKNPQKVLENTPYKKVIQTLRSIHRRHMPVVDENNKFVRVVSLDDIEFNLRKNKVVIMAGGLGTRLGNLTKETPKPMLEIGGTPLLEQLINSFVEYGFRDFLISVNYKAEVISDYFSDGQDFGVNISYLREKEKLGTAGSLSLIKSKIEEPFIVINGDVLTSLDYGDLLQYHVENNSFGTMCIKEYEHNIPYATVNTSSSKLLSIEEKPVIKFKVNSGIYVLEPEALEYIPQNTFFDMPTLFEKAVEDKKSVYTYVMNDFWLDIGQIKDYDIANEHFKKNQ